MSFLWTISSTFCLFELDWFGVIWCSTKLSTLFQLYHVSQFYCWGKTEDLEKPTDLSQVT